MSFRGRVGKKIKEKTHFPPPPKKKLSKLKSSCYNSSPWDAPFFAEHGRWNSGYGRFFLEWYSGCLVAHADLVLGACREALDAALLLESSSSATASAASSSDSDPEESSSSPPGFMETARSQQQRQKRPRLGAKLAGIHWWYGHPSHAAELTVSFFSFLTFFLFLCSLCLSHARYSLSNSKSKPKQAGYYNVYHRDGYLPLLDVLAQHGAEASFTCVEMRDCEHPPHAHCRPQALLDQVFAAASVAGRSNSTTPNSRKLGGVPLSGENALERYDDYAASALAERASSLSQLTFLRMGDLMFENWGAFEALLAKLRVRE